MTEPPVKILLVDDVPGSLLTLEATLASPEYHLITATSGEAALRCLLQHDVALIILDVHMPGLDGFETASLIRTRERQQATPIMFLTATEDQSHFRGYTVGAVDYLVKPVSPAILKAKVRVFADLYRHKQRLATFNEALEQQVAEQTATLRAEIAERKRAEEALRCQAALLDQSYDAVFALELHGPIMYWNQGAERLYGIPSAEAVGRVSHDLLHTVFPDSLQDCKDALARTGRWEGELDQQARDGRRILVESRMTLVREAGSTLVLEANRDITERKRAEEALQEYQERLAKIVATAPGVVCSFRLRPDGSTCFPYGGERIAEFYGVTPGRLAEDASAIFPLIHPDDVGHMRETIAESARTMRPWRYEWRVCNPVRGQFWLEGHSVPLREPDGSILWHGIVADITERKRVEEVLQKSHVQLRALTARLADAEDIERRRLSQELHDRVGQSLTALGISLSVVRGEVAAGAAAQADARLEDALGLLGEAVERTRDVMGDLRPPVLDDYGLAAALRWHGERFAKRAGVAVLLEGDDPSPRLAASVEMALFRIAQEALTNVAKHARARRVTLTLETADGTSRLIIADDGAGFDPKAPRPPGGPQGWGLLTMRERAEAVGGRLEVESTPGQGTRVVVEVGGVTRWASAFS